jgi:hypothetical protein
LLADSPRRVRRSRAEIVEEQRFAAAHDEAHLVNAIRDSGGEKVVALAARVSRHTATNYRRGHSIPSGMNLMRLMRWSKRIAETVLWLTGLDDASMDAREARGDAREAALTRELHNRLARQGVVVQPRVPADVGSTATHDAGDDATPGNGPGGRVGRRRQDG